MPISVPTGCRSVDRRSEVDGDRHSDMKPIAVPTRCRSEVGRLSRAFEPTRTTSGPGSDLPGIHLGAAARRLVRLRVLYDTSAANAYILQNSKHAAVPARFHFLVLPTRNSRRRHGHAGLRSRRAGRLDVFGVDRFWHMRHPPAQLGRPPVSCDALKRLPARLTRG
jgi:hypothetical protein